MNIQENVASLLSFFLVLYLVNKSDAAVGPCIYDVDSRGIIDLTVVGRMDGIPVWKDIIPQVTDDHVYSYNPCYPFSQGNCINVAACQTHITDKNLAYSLGPQNSIQWAKVSGQDLPTLTYTDGERTLHVNLICLKSGDPDSLLVHGYESSTNSYIMVLSSVCACYDGCKDGHRPVPHPRNGVSGGLIIIIVLLVLIIIYLITFMAFNKFKNQATGIDILPHRTFWISLPGYSLDGVRFIFRKATGKSGYSTVS